MSRASERIAAKVSISSWSSPASCEGTNPNTRVSGHSAVVVVVVPAVVVVVAASSSPQAPITSAIASKTTISGLFRMSVTLPIRRSEEGYRACEGCGRGGRTLRSHPNLVDNSEIFETEPEFGEEGTHPGEVRFGHCFEPIPDEDLESRHESLGILCGKSQHRLHHPGPDVGGESAAKDDQFVLDFVGNGEDPQLLDHVGVVLSQAAPGVPGPQGAADQVPVVAEPARGDEVDGDIGPLLGPIPHRGAFEIEGGGEAHRGEVGGALIDGPYRLGVPARLDRMSLFYP